MLELSEIHRRLANNFVIDAAFAIGNRLEFRANDLHRIGFGGGADEAFLAQ